MSDIDILELVRVLRDEVLATAEHGDRDPPGAEVFDALLRALQLGGDSMSSALDLGLHDAVARRLAWGDSEETQLADAEMVFDRLMTASERAFRDPADRMVVIEAATQVAVTVARVVARGGAARGSRSRGALARGDGAAPAQGSHSQAAREHRAARARHARRRAVARRGGLASRSSRSPHRAAAPGRLRDRRSDARGHPPRGRRRARCGARWAGCGARCA